MNKIESLIEELRAGRISRRQFIRQALVLGAAGASLELGIRETAAQASDVLVGFSFTSFEHFR